MRWSDYTHDGRWTHSCLYDADGNYFATCHPQYLTDHCTRIVRVHWSTYHDDTEGEAPSRREAKRAVRAHLRTLGL